MIQGMTAVLFGTIAYPIKAGDTVLVHAAAGGTGQLLSQVRHDLLVCIHNNGCAPVLLSSSLFAHECWACMWYKLVWYKLDLCPFNVFLLPCSQVACASGANVIGTTSTTEKVETAKGCGAKQVILHTKQNILEEVTRMTGVCVCLLVLFGLLAAAL